ncbi:hypothetical protein Golax_009113 [Gossypium laxum]|uniref:Uncharacterized protein n=1 Tax=Gossypium laxum TaxID=34288 RepID=A0A7J9AC72_9ROSI|nr:hypothetical protein [Gossypium laxum]
MGHGLKECDRIPTGARDKPEDELPYSLALKAESNLLRKECLEFSASTKKSMTQCLYVGDVTRWIGQRAWLVWMLRPAGLQWKIVKRR